MWKIIDSGKASAPNNMAIDESLLKGLTEGSLPILHFYDWEGACATYGHFIKPWEHFKRERVVAQKFQLAQRPTGGGIIFHVTDFAFSVLVPAGHPAYSFNPLDNYAFVNRLVVQVIKRLMGNGIQAVLLAEQPEPLNRESRHFCMAHPTKYDVVVEGKKVGGAAQRKTKLGFLHQGTISLALPPEDLLRDLLYADHQVIKATQLSGYSLLGSEWTPSQLIEGKVALRKFFVEEICL